MINFLVGFALIGAAVLALRQLVTVLARRSRKRPSPARPNVPPAPSGDPPGNRGGEAAAARELAAALVREERPIPGVALLDDPRIAAVVQALAQPAIPLGESWNLARSRTNDFEIILGLAALRKRDDTSREVVEWAVGTCLRDVDTVIEPFVYALLLARAESPVIGRALAALAVGADHDELATFIVARRMNEVVSQATFADVPIAAADGIGEFIRTHEARLGADFRELFETWRAAVIDVDFLRNVGIVWDAPYDRPETLLAGDRGEIINQMCEALAHTPPRSLLLVGEHGVGKTALLRAAFDRAERPLVVFEATASQINAGAMYVGQLEGRAQELVKRLRHRNVVWVMPQLQEAFYAGQHNQSPQGLLDALLPHIESGEICIVGEIGTAEYERLIASRARVASAFDVLRIRPLGEAESVAVARHALAGGEGAAYASNETLFEAQELAQQFLPGVAAPGNTLRLMTAAAAEVLEEGRREITSADVLATLAATSGLPLAMLDPSIRLSLDDVRAFFEERVLGQSEAINGVVERIAIARAGLNDPTRPLGVLLLVGPTGTGKTELAKSLAEFMFGSANRLVRVDMSEYQTHSSLERLLADTSVDRDGAQLIAAVRKDPFSVVLLDEFEKAASPIWDVFLQVFDDGRLTDVHGRTVDFRRCVFLLTSNIGSAIATGNPVGFDRTKEAFAATRVEEAVARTFRPEFLNRIDRVIVFAPFAREQMHALLQKELRDVLTRRGLRAQPWAIELDESAAEYLIEQGFSPALGARPLKRAVERHLLAPLAEVIVEQTAPAGDLFLFVSRAPSGGVSVSFVNLGSADDSHVGSAHVGAEELAALDLRAIARTGRADSQRVRVLLAELDAITERVHGEAREAREATLAATGREGFWEEEERFATLAIVEYVDRLEAATDTAQRLGSRLARQADDDSAGTGNVASLLASRLLVLQSALEGMARHSPHEVYLHIRPAADADSEEVEQWMGQISAMYEAWALARGMTIERIGDDKLFRVSGLASGEILMRETGLHVLELISQGESGDRLVRRVACVVEVAGRDPRDAGERSQHALASAALKRRATVPAVVRRYRPEPTPLVRDAVRGYRTGRLDRVLAGDFDLFGD